MISRNTRPPDRFCGRRCHNDLSGATLMVTTANLSTVQIGGFAR